jgi:hypothetical protein
MYNLIRHPTLSIEDFEDLGIQDSGLYGYSLSLFAYTGSHSEN